MTMTPIVHFGKKLSEFKKFVKYTSNSGSKFKTTLLMKLKTKSVPFKFWVNWVRWGSVERSTKTKR